MKFYPVFQAQKPKYSPLRGEIPDNYLAIGQLEGNQHDACTLDAHPDMVRGCFLSFNNLCPVVNRAVGPLEITTLLHEFFFLLACCLEQKKLLPVSS